jgi:hypothetical protein
VQALILPLGDDGRVAPGRHLVTGWAWSAWPVTRVEISTDGGAAWHEARLDARGPAPTWQRFAFEWQASAPGTYEIRAGHRQPGQGPAERGPQRRPRRPRGSRLTRGPQGLGTWIPVAGRLDFVAAVNSMGLHAPQQRARILGEVTRARPSSRPSARCESGSNGGGGHCP